MRDVPGVGHQGRGHRAFQQASDLQKARHGKVAGGHQVQGIGSLGLGLAGPGHQLRVVERHRFGEDAGLDCQRAEAAVERAGRHIDGDVNVVLTLSAETFPWKGIGCLHQGVALPAVQGQGHEGQGLVAVQTLAGRTLF